MARQNVSARVQLDEASLRELKSLLKQLPPKFRGKAALRAFKKAGKPMLDELRNAGRSAFPASSSIGKSFQIVNGKHSRKDPYVVLQHRRKAFKHRRTVMGAYSATGVTNWANIGHLTASGTNAGPRRAGVSIRQERYGRNRIKLFKLSGEAAYSRQTDTGRYFVVVGAGGRVHPLRTINHPGSRAGEYFDTALGRGGGRAAGKYMDAAELEIAVIRKKLLNR